MEKVGSGSGLVLAYLPSPFALLKTANATNLEG
jgi:hypothetical protein